MNLPFLFLNCELQKQSPIAQNLKCSSPKLKQSFYFLKREKDCHLAGIVLKAVMLSENLSETGYSSSCSPIISNFSFLCPPVNALKKKIKTLFALHIWITFCTQLGVFPINFRNSVFVSSTPFYIPFVIVSQSLYKATSLYKIYISFHSLIL